MMILRAGIVAIALAMVITGWVPMARIVRGQILKLKNQEFIMAARTLGASHKRLIWKHLMPNALGPIIVNLTFTIPTAIFFEAFLSFIGLEVLQPPNKPRSDGERRLSTNAFLSVSSPHSFDSDCTLDARVQLVG